jgi:hypothetical protein
MTEFRRRPVADLRHRLEQAEGEMLAVAALVAAGRAPDDEAERGRCRLVAERIATKGRGVVDMLARPPTVGLEARVVAEQDRALDEARDREGPGT